MLLLRVSDSLWTVSALMVSTHAVGGSFITVRALALLLVCVGIARYLMVVARPRLVLSSDSRYKKDGTLQRVQSLHRVLTPPPWAFDSTFQIIFFLLRNMWCSRRVTFQQESVPNPEKSGNVLTLSWDLSSLDVKEDSPILLFMHGLMCNSDDLPGTSFVHAAAQAGFRVCVMNRPGHNGPLVKPRFSIFGDHRDLDAVVRHIKSRYPKSTLSLVAFSAGCYPALRYLGTTGKSSLVDASVMISGGISVDDALTKCGWLFEKIFLANCKQYFLKTNKVVLRSHNSEAFDQAMSATNSADFVKATSAYGCDSGTWEDMKALIDPLDTINNVSSPVLFLNGDDDPIVPTSSIDPHVKSFYESNPNVLLARTATGSHCPFLHGWFAPEDFAEATTLEWLKHQVYLRNKN